MSPFAPRRLDWAISFPRVSGDEPARTIGIECRPEFSPRERG